MPKYRCVITHYQSPDRGDSNGGWRHADTINFDAADDEAAVRHAQEHIVRVYGPGRNSFDDLRATLEVFQKVAFVMPDPRMKVSKG